MKKSLCDHDNCITSFCPNCGDPILATPLASLYAHLKNRAAQLRKQVDNWGKYERPTEEDAPSAYKEKRRKLRVKSAEKWESWEKLLQDLIDGE